MYPRQKLQLIYFRSVREIYLFSFSYFNFTESIYLQQTKLLDNKKVISTIVLGCEGKNQKALTVHDDITESFFKGFDALRGWSMLHQATHQQWAVHWETEQRTSKSASHQTEQWELLNALLSYSVYCSVLLGALLGTNRLSPVHQSLAFSDLRRTLISLFNAWRCCIFIGIYCVCDLILKKSKTVKGFIRFKFVPCANSLQI